MRRLFPGVIGAGGGGGGGSFIFPPLGAYSGITAFSPALDGDGSVDAPLGSYSGITALLPAIVAQPAGSIVAPLGAFSGVTPLEPIVSDPNADEIISPLGAYSGITAFDPEFVATGEVIAPLGAYSGITPLLPTVAAQGNGSIVAPLGAYSGITELAPTIAAQANGSIVAPLGAYSGITALLPTVAAQAVFAPTDIASLELWLDASDAASITDTAGEVSQWNDLSTAGNNVDSAANSDEPNTSAINGNDSIFFDGTGDRLRDETPVVTSPPATFAVVFTPTSVAAGDAFAVRCRLGFTDVFRVGHNGSDIEINEGSGGATTTMTIAGTLVANETRWLIFRARNSADGTSDVLDNQGGSASATLAAAIGTFDEFNIGANANGNEPLEGHIHEVLYYNRFLTDQERTDLGDFLDGKWSVASATTSIVAPLGSYSGVTPLAPTVAAQADGSIVAPLGSYSGVTPLAPTLVSTGEITAPLGGYSGITALAPTLTGQGTITAPLGSYSGITALSPTLSEPGVSTTREAFSAQGNVNETGSREAFSIGGAINETS